MSVQAPIAGHAPWCPAVGDKPGAAAVSGPPDRGLPANGLNAVGEPDVAGRTFATASLRATREVRTGRGVLDHARCTGKTARLAHVTRACPG